MSQPQIPERAKFRLTLLGSPALSDASGLPVPGLGPGKPLAMLAYLALAGSTGRETLVALLWDDMPEERARNAFRQTLHRLRSALGADVLLAERDTVSLAHEDILWCDAVEFAATGRRHDLDRAIELYGGPFVGALDVGSAPFEQWAEEQRDRFSALYHDTLKRAAQNALENGDLPKAEKHARALATEIPLDSDAALLEATVLLTAGRRPEAVTSLTIYGNRLRQEMGADAPASITGMLHRLMREGGVGTADSANGRPSGGLERPVFAGREAELGRLLGVWRRIGEGGATVVVTGPPGMGKTRLVAEVADRLKALGTGLVLWGQERPASQAVPYAAIAEALRPAVSAPGVAGASRHLLAEAARLLPELRDQFDLPEPNPIEDDAARVRFYDGLAALLDAVSYEQPVCVILDSMHMAPQSSVTLLRYLADRLSSAPVMFVVLYREAEAPLYLLKAFPPGGEADLPGVNDGALTEEAVRAIRLAPLPGEAITVLVQSITASNLIEAEDHERLIELSEGVPLRAIELVRRLTNNQPLTTAPREISDILWTELQSCSALEQRFFLATALYWRAVSLRTLATATHLSEPEALDTALALEKRGLVTQRSGGLAPAHDTVATRALTSAGSAGLALLAGWAADALSTEPGATHAELAHLFSMSGQKSAAHRHSRAAVHDAAASAAYDQIEPLLQVALQTATSESDRVAVESLRRAFGGGLKMLPGRAPPAAPSSELPDVEEPASIGANSSVPAPETRRAGPLLRRRFVITAIAAGLVTIAALAAVQRDTDPAIAVEHALSDTLLVSEKLNARAVQRFQLYGRIGQTPALTRTAPATTPAWVDSISLPWLNARVSPDGRFVAVERMTGAGTDLFLIRANRSDTVALATGAGDDIALGWSPDGAWLLATRGRTSEGVYQTELLAYSVVRPDTAVSIDATPGRSVEDAAWSPRGTMVAWVARSGDTRQQDIFVSDPRGGGSRNVTSHSAEDYHPAWSPDGETVTFTSDRNGNAELYAMQLSTRELRRLTIDAAHDDRASYSPDGDFIAFESTRGGRVGVYVMLPTGRSQARVTPANRDFELAGWRGRLPSFVDRVRLAAPEALSAGDSALVTARVYDQFGAALSGVGLKWRTLGERATVIPRQATAPAPASNAVLLARSEGLARIVAFVEGWRSDTAHVRIGDVLAVLSDDFEGGVLADRWLPLGSPLPTVARSRGSSATTGVALNADNQWESGLLSRGVFPLRAGLSVTAWISAPFAASPMPATAGVWLVAAEGESSVDSEAPQFLKIAGLSWLAEAGRVAYSAGREFSTEPAAALRLRGPHLFRMTVERDNRLSFYVDGQLRRRSTVLVSRPGEEPRVQLWIGGRGTGADVVVDDVRVVVEDIR